MGQNDLVKTFGEGYEKGKALRKSPFGPLLYEFSMMFGRNALYKAGLAYGYSGGPGEAARYLARACRNGILTPDVLLEIGRRYGLLRTIVLMIEEGIISPDRDTVEALRRELFLDSDDEWERKLSSKLGLPSLFDIYRWSIAVAYSNGVNIEVGLYSWRGESLIFTAELEKLERLLGKIGAQTVIYYGIPILLETIPTVNYTLLAKLAIPMLRHIHPRRVAVALGIQEPAKLTIIQALLETAPKLVLAVKERLGDMLDRPLPGGLQALYRVEPPPGTKVVHGVKLYVPEQPLTTGGRTVSPVASPGRGPKGLLLLTDDVPALAPRFSPYIVLLPDKKPADDPVENYAILLMYSTARLYGWWYDPAILPSGLAKRLRDKIVSTVALHTAIRKKCAEPPETLFVEPGNIYSMSKLCPEILSTRHLHVECYMPVLECILYASAVREEESLLLGKKGRMLRIKRPGNAKPVSIYGHVFYEADLETLKDIYRLPAGVSIVGHPGSLPEIIVNVIGVEPEKPKPPIKVKVRVHNKSNLTTSLPEILSLASAYKSDTTLYLTPNRALAQLITAHLGSEALSAFDLSTRPGVVKKVDKIVLLYPERFWRTPSLTVLSKGLTVKTVQHRLYDLARMIGRFAEIHVVTRMDLHESDLFEIEGEEPLGDPIVPDEDRLLEANKLLLGEAEEIISRYWSYLSGRPASLRGYQRRVIAYILSMYTLGLPSTIIVTLPTGAGKSILYQTVAPLLADLGLGLGGIVVTPLRALMHDQVNGLLRKGVSASYIDAGVSKAARAEIVKAYSQGILDLLYVTPERFEDPILLKTIAPPARPVLVVLDEVHTLSRWGRSFRPAYLHMSRRLADRNRRRPKIPVLGLTATLPPQMEEDILSILYQEDSVKEKYSFTLNLDDNYTPGEESRWPHRVPLVVRGPILRPELRFDVIDVPPAGMREEVFRNLLKKLESKYQKLGEPYLGLVFTGFVESERNSWANVENVAEIASSVVGKGNVISYHGGLDDGERRRREEIIYESSRTGRGPHVIVATKAFGMGVDLPNIRYVIHYMMSESIEDYYQEAGRAGRDRERSDIVTLYNVRDEEARLYLLESSRVSPTAVLRVYNTIVRLHKELARLAGREAKLDPHTILVPANLFSALLPPKHERDAPLRLAQKTLDLLADYGYLTYQTISTRLYPIVLREEYSSPSGLTYQLTKTLYLTTEPPETAPRVSLDVAVGRVTGTIDYIPLRVSCCGEKLIDTDMGDEVRFRLKVDARPRYYIIVRLDPEKRYNTWKTLPPGLLAYIFHVRGEDEERVRTLSGLLKKAAKAKQSGGNPDKVIRTGIEEYFKREPAEPPPTPETPSPGYDICYRDECVLRAAALINSLAKQTRCRGVVLAYSREEDLLAVKRILTRVGLPCTPSTLRMHRLTQSYKSRGLLALLDRGFIVALVPMDKQRLAHIEEMSSHYRYFWGFVYR